MAAVAPVRPLLKWAGGKRQILPRLRPFYPATFGTYFEPFVGSGAVFFDLWNEGRLASRRVVLVDDNIDLIGCYRAVREDVEAVIRALETLADGHAAGGAAHYYAVRDGRFNPAREKIRASADPAGEYGTVLAAMLIYLNRTGYNGLFRLNSRGGFNVPVGRYVRPAICDAANLRSVSRILQTPGVALRRGGFAEVEKQAQAGDFLYFDPPYAPVSATARFTSYTPSGFSPADQQRLHRLVLDLARRGCHVLVSNSTAPEIVGLYELLPETRVSGLRAHRIPARRAINSRADRRHAIDEYLLTNVLA